MVVSTQITSNDIYTCIAVLVSYWAVKFWLKTEKIIEAVKKYDIFFKKL